MGSDDYYKILKVNHDATFEELKNSFENLSLKWYPGKVKNIKKIYEAYDVLRNPKKREIYDKYGKYPVNLDVFNEEYGDGNNFSAVGAVEIELYCTLEELYSGCRKQLTVPRTVCDGLGKSERVEEILLIDIKPGWKKGTKITFRGKGNHLPGSRPTDLIFVVKETPHVLFKRDGRDLVMTQKISLLEALVGTTLNITTLDGREIMVKVTDIVTPQYEKVVSDEGMPRKDPSRKGKLRIKFHIEYPSMLTSQQKLEVRRILRNAAYN